MKVAVFGGASVKQGDQTYLDALRLGSLLAEHGYTVMTGGYIGIMEAASRGANESGGHVIGVTCREIEEYRKTKANQWVMEEWSYTTLRERMYALIDNCDAAVVMPGGVGTLTELAATWNELIVNGKKRRPLILVGGQWEKIINSFFDSFGHYIHEGDQKLIYYADNIDAVIEILTQ